jgi:hypothetical protein
MKRLLLASLVVLAGCDKPVTYEPSAEKRTADIEHQSLDEAKGLDARGDVEGAHAKLSQIKPDSPLRSTPDYQNIENKWAQLLLDKADREQDKTKKIALLDTVAQATGVSGELRAKANQKLEAANPAPAIPPPEQSYDPKEAAERLAKAQELGKQRKTREARDLLLGPVTAHKAAPQEASLLVSLCVTTKDTECLNALSDAGVVDSRVQAAMSTPRR